METTRHHTATAYVVESGAVALHRHDGLDRWLPPGGHLDRDELPHEAARREVEEELGMAVELVAETETIESETVAQLPQPQHYQLADVTVTDQGISHQHIDQVYYARAPHRTIEPAPGEQPASDWSWFTAAELRERAGEIDPDVVEIGQLAIESVTAEHDTG
jgi:8-oxo-dGTP pyrophosphatase MutT (NUDIX family)